MSVHDGPDVMKFDVNKELLMKTHAGSILMLPFFSAVSWQQSENLQEACQSFLRGVQGPAVMIGAPAWVN